MRKEHVIKMANEMIRQHGRVTVRQIYYQLYPQFHGDYKNDRSFYSSFDRILVTAREHGEVPVNCVIDTARRKMGEYDDPTDPSNFLKEQVENFLILDELYTRNRWENQPIMPIVWVEKDALSRIIHSVASNYRVMTYPSRGYSSMHYLWNTLDKNHNIKILHLADHDPSGIDMTRDISKRVSKYAKKDMAIERIALTSQQVKKYNLVPNPTKRADSRRKKYVESFGDNCWELDAIPPDELKNIVKNAILKEINLKSWKETVTQEDKDKEELKKKIAKVEKNLKTLIEN